MARFREIATIPEWRTREFARWASWGVGIRRRRGGSEFHGLLGGWGAPHCGIHQMRTQTIQSPIEI